MIPLLSLALGVCFPSPAASVGPTRDLIADLAIEGPQAEYHTAHFQLDYAASATSKDAVAEVEATTVTLPDGSVFVLEAGGVPNYVEAAGHYLEYARAQYIALGFQAPPESIEVRFLWVNNQWRGTSFAPFGIAMSSRMNLVELGWVAAHELFHQIQYTYAPAGIGLNYFLKFDNPLFYDTFALEGVANCGADLLFGTPALGSAVDSNASAYLRRPDVDFWNQTYDAAFFWKYLFEQTTEVAGDLAGVDVLQRFVYERGRVISTAGALEQTLQAVHGPSLSTLLERFRVAAAVKQYFNVDPTVPSELRRFDFSHDSDTWPLVATQGELEVASSRSDQFHIAHDGGALYFRIRPPSDADHYVARLVAASNDVRAQLIQVVEGDLGPDNVVVTAIAGRQGAATATVQIPPRLLATYAVVASLDGSQPFILDFNPGDGPVPVLTRGGCNGGGGCNDRTDDAPWTTLGAAVMFVGWRRRKLY